VVGQLTAHASTATPARRDLGRLPPDHEGAHRPGPSGFTDFVPTTQSADLPKYYSKHTKNDRLDSEVLARLPLLHPEGLREFSGNSSADSLRRLTKQRSTLVKRPTAVSPDSTRWSSCSARPGTTCSARIPARLRWRS